MIRASIDIGEVEKHILEIRADLSLRRNLDGDWKAEVLVDREPRADLIPERWRRWARRWNDGRRWAFLEAIAIVFLLVLLVLVLVKALSG